MAEYHVSTINQLLDNLWNKTSSDTVIFDNDIDCQGKQWDASWVTCNINGNGFSMFNIDNRSSYVFNLRQTGLTIQNIKFRNITTYNYNKFFGYREITPYSSFCTVRNCQFQGIFEYLADDCVNFDRCAFSIERFKEGSACSSNSTSSVNPTFTNCYFDFTQWDIPTVSTISIDNSIMGASKIENCYFKGRIDVPQNRFFSVITNSCVFNFNKTGSGRIDFSGNNNMKSIYNSDRMSNVVNAIACTDAEMKNAQALFNKGFDIVV